MDFVDHQSAEIVHSNFEEMQSRQEALDAMLSDVSKNIRDIERNTTRALLDFEADVVARSEQTIGSLWQHYDAVIADYARQFDQRIKAQAQETQVSIAELTTSLQQMAMDANGKHDFAVEWLDAADMYCAYIQQYFNTEQFTPGRLEWLERQLEQAHQNLDMGLTEAVITSAQQLVLSFSELRVELERLQNEWVLLYQAAWESINRLLIQVDESQFVEAVDLEGQLIPSKIEVDFWSAGRLNQLYENALSIRVQMENEQSPPDRELLVGWLDVDLPQYREELEDTVVQARIHVLNSQLRINIADLVVQALQAQGFALEESDYIQNDMRMAYDAHLANLEGNQVVIQVAPAGEKIGQNELHFQSMDREQRTEHELEQRWLEISRSLQQHGVEVGQCTRLDRNDRQNRYHPGLPGNRANQNAYRTAQKTVNTHGYRTTPPDHSHR